MSDESGYDRAHGRFTAAIRPILLDPSQPSPAATMAALLDCIGAILAGAVEAGGPSAEQFADRLRTAIQQSTSCIKPKGRTH